METHASVLLDINDTSQQVPRRIRRIQGILQDLDQPLG